MYSINFFSVWGGGGTGVEEFLRRSRSKCETKSIMFLGLQFHYMSVEFGCSDGMKKLIKILGPVEYFEERFQRCVVKSQY